MTKSINQLAQLDGDTAANTVRRIREDECSVRNAWRQIAYHEGEESCTLARIVEMTGYSEDYVRFVCGNVGYELK